MKRFLGAVLGAVLATAGAAQEAAVPDFRYIVTRDVDFYGADLDALFDTDLKSCVRACTANPACRAFTFNTRSNACFPKAGVTDTSPYTGAYSAEKLPAAPGLAQAAAPRAAALGFLSQTDRARAFAQARDLGLRHPAGGFDLGAVLDAVRGTSNPVQALNLTGAAVVMTDRSDLWTDYARRALGIRSDKSSDRRAYARRAVSAAINGYLRGASPAARAAALEVLADALQRAGRGRASIPALRLALDEQPRSDIEEALESAIAKYGFRVTDSTVESDSALPRICAQFSEPLVKSGLDYDPFVRVSEPGLPVRADGNQLCIDGVEHGQRYRITLRRGLPALSGETLWKDVEITHYVRDRAPAVRFPGRAYVLPTTPEAALPVETVNVTALNLTLRRMSDRNLLRAVQEGYFGRPLSQWQDETFGRELAEEIWTGTAGVPSELNRDLTTRLPLAEALAGQRPGIYTLTARVPGVDPYDDPGATQWFVLSDLGLSTMKGADGLHVWVRGLSDAAARTGVALTLVSRANAVLGTATTDADGFARFDPGLTRGLGGAEPALLLADAGGSDLGFLTLTDPAFDLSDRGVEGRAPAGAIDVFLTTDRGAYRAGETIHATALSRDGTAQAIEGLPLIAILTRPDGVEYRRRISDGGTAGGHVFALPTGTTVPRGAWTLDIKSDPKAPALASQTILIEDFIPERIDFDLALPEEAIRLGDAPALSVEARYLFGAPGADLSVEGQVVLRPAREIDGWVGYRFGRHDDRPAPRSAAFSGGRTDAAGHADVLLDLPEPDVPGLPMELTVIARLADGAARPVERRISAPVQPDAAVIGIKPLFDDVVAEGTDARFEVIGLSPELTPEPMAVKWTLNRVSTRYQWYQQYGNWNWEPVTRRTRIATGEARLGAEPLAIAQPVDWGSYELVIERLESDGPYTAASLDFYAGWYAPADASAAPDKLELSLDRADYAVGDTALLRIVPRAAGTALVTVMSNRVITRQVVEVPAGESRIPLPVTENWGTGAYVSAMVIRPENGTGGRVPVRSLGLAHAAIAPGDKQLAVTIDAPEVALPRQVQNLRVRVENAAPGDPVHLTLAAVDLGILNLTGFKAPDPSAHYFGQRRLGMELRDVYGRLIDGRSGAMGTVRSGGDGDQGAALQSPPPTQDLMAVFSGLVTLAEDGTATIPVELPAFNGTVRLMAVAWSPRAVGQASRDMIVRDPVVVTASVPRFLAPGDRGRVRLDVVHADGLAGEMSLALAATGGDLTLGASPGRFTLAPGGKATFTVPVTAGAAGDPAIAVTLTTPEGEALTQDLRLPIRANDPIVAQTRRFTLAGGQTFAMTADVFAGLRAGTGKAVLSAGPLAKFDAPGLLSSLDRYPYGCTEQIASRALPLLYLSSVASATGLGSGPAVRERVDQAIARVLTRQATNGAFGLWRAEAGDFWLDAYASDFLSRARAEGFSVPPRAFDAAMDNLRNRINYAPDFDHGGQDIAYALMVLAREGAASMGDLRYYADVKAEAFATPLAAAQIGAALASYGDQTRADAMFARAARMLNAPADTRMVWRSDYGTAHRDAAAVLALATEAGSSAIDASALSDRLARNSGRLSTQEATWTLLAANALIRQPERSGLRVNGAPVTGPFVQVLEAGTPTGGLAITAASGQTEEITLTTLGVPEVAPPAGGTGFAIERRYFAMDGSALDGTAFAVGERFVTVLTVKPFEKSEARLMIDDPLPAGVEIDNPNLLRSGDIGALDWLKVSDTQNAEFRSDRFLAAVDLRGTGTVTLAYVARAVSPGSFHHPAASVEDMYRPRYRARTATGRVTVSE